MDTTYLVSIETLKTFCQGALGAMTFGAYHQYTTNKIIELNNENIKNQNKYLIDKIEIQHEKEIDEIKNKYEKKINMMETQQKILGDKLEKLEKIVSQQKGWW